MAAKQCSICVHPRRQAAEALLAEGLSPRKAAKQLNISYSSLERHRTSCMLKALRPKEELVPMSLSDPQKELERLHSETICVLEAAKKANDPAGILNAVSQARLNVQLAARMAGVLEPKGTDPNSGTLTLQAIVNILQVHKRA